MLSAVLWAAVNTNWSVTTKTARHIRSKHSDSLLSEPDTKHANLCFYQPNRFAGVYLLRLWCRYVRRNPLLVSHIQDVLRSENISVITSANYFCLKILPVISFTAWFSLINFFTLSCNFCGEFPADYKRKKNKHCWFFLLELRDLLVTFHFRWFGLVSVWLKWHSGPVLDQTHQLFLTPLWWSRIASFFEINTIYLAV